MRIQRKDGPHTMLRKSFRLREVKFSSSAPAGTFSGYGAVFNNIDDGGDLILPGAFKDTLAEWQADGNLPKMLWQHGIGDDGNDMLPIGVWTKMEEDSTGLAVEGLLDPIDTERGKTIHAGMKNRAIDALSITYVATDVVYGSKEGDPFRTIRKLDLYECGPVLFGMNELATIDQTKAASLIKTVRDFENFLRDVGGFSHAAAKAIASGGYKANPTLRDEGGTADELEDLRKRAASIFST
ncbi:MAG: HK97 family phage prohead protease [Bradyrhizobium sp.]|nr:HK97 family phage prohead protease [Bradyrhizobium sp.]